MTDYQTFRSKQSRYKSGDGDIYYMDRGEGPVLVLLHGFPVSSWIYRCMIDRMVDEGCRVIAPDMLGFGSSDSPDDLSIYDPERQALRLLSLMESLEINEWTQVVHDLGGIWTWKMIEQESDVISHLIILNTILLPAGFRPPFKTSIRTINKCVAKIYGWKMAARFLAKQLIKSTYQNDPGDEIIHGIITPWLEKKTTAIEHFLHMIGSEMIDVRPILEKYKGRVTVIWGNDDEVLQWKKQDQEVKPLLGLKDDDIYEIEGKHFIQDEQCRQVSKTITHRMQLKTLLERP